MYQSNEPAFMYLDFDDGQFLDATWSDGTKEELLCIERSASHAYFVNIAGRLRRIDLDPDEYTECL